MTQIMVENGRLIMREMQVKRERGEIDRQRERESVCERDRDAGKDTKRDRQRGKL